MFIKLGFIAAACLIWPRVRALPQVEQSQYLTRLKAKLFDEDLITLGSAVERIESTTEGKAFLDSFYSDDEYTVFAPTDLAWKGYGLDSGNIRDENAYWLQDVLKYHMTKSKTPLSHISPPRTHTVLPTLYRNSTLPAPSAPLDEIYGNMPGVDTQVLVLEQDTGEAGKRALVRGDGWNVSTVDQGVGWENLLIQKVDRIIPYPSPFLTTLLSPLLSSSPWGLTISRSLINVLEKQLLFNNATGITAFLPVDADVAGVLGGVAGMERGLQENMLFNHIVNGTILYSPSLLPSKSLITARGERLDFFQNDTGTYISSGNVTANVLRTDVITSNGVIHVIDKFLANPDRNNGAAASAYSSALQSASAAVGSATAQSMETARSRNENGATALKGSFGLLCAVAVVASLTT